MLKRVGNWEFQQPVPDVEPALMKVFEEMGPGAEAFARELVEEAGQGKFSFEGLCEARYRGQIAAAVFPQTLPGKAGILWLSRLVPPQAADSFLRLIGMSLDFFVAHRVRLAYTLFPEVRPELESVLARHDFRFLAELFYLGCPAEEFPADEPELPLQFESFSSAGHERLARVVEGTYRETLDCADLKDVRSTEDVIEGYRGIGEFSPDRWFVVRQGEADVGCLLLGKHVAQDALELVYMGILPEYRGKGLGRLVARYAQWVAGISGVSRILLAVDSVNEPAVEMYASVGFQRWDQRRVLCKVFP